MGHRVRVLLLFGLLGTATAAYAVPVTIDFTVSSTAASYAGYAVGVNGSGHFTFDDSLVAPGFTGSIRDVTTGISTLDLEFTWNGISFDETTARIGILTFSGGVLTDWLIGGLYNFCSTPSQVLNCVSAGGSEPDFTMNGTNFGALNDGSIDGFAYFVVPWSVRGTSVPAPGPLALFGLGLAGLALRRRHRTS